VGVENGAGAARKGLTVSAPETRAKTCLIVEDETLIALLIEEAIVEMGLTCLGPFSSVSPALERLKDESPDCAVLDINLGGEPIHPVASTLAERNIPFVFVSGYGHTALEAGLPKGPVLDKPFAIDQLQDAVRALLDKT
jgi:DNA-binding response OmpR family regulator